MSDDSLLTMPSSSTSRSQPYCNTTRPESFAPGKRHFNNKDSNNLWSPCSNCSSSDEDNSPTAINNVNWDKPALEDKTVDFGWTSQVTTDQKDFHETSSRHLSQTTGKKLGGYVNLRTRSKKESSRSSSHKERSSIAVAGDEVTSPTWSGRPSGEERLRDCVDSSECEDFQDAPGCYSRSEEDIQKEKDDLRNVAWFQAGIPREIALEVLAEKPEGSFIVRESTTKPGCYALSLRVPAEKNPTGIAHYLILRTNRGYKIKGFTKEFSTLNALITHHSVMPELLPCPLSLSRTYIRDADQEFEDTEQKPYDVFEDIHWIMTDLEI